MSSVESGRDFRAANRNAPAVMHLCTARWFRACCIALPILFVSQACTTVTHREYTPLIQVLDEKNELKVSTYPAWFPKDVGPGKLETHGEVYFQLYVKDRQRTAGPNPHVETVEFHSFAYRMDDGPKTVLLTDYPRSFWMQNNRNYESRDLPPIPYRRNSRITVEVELTLNGKRHNVQGVMPSRERRTTAPNALIR